MVAVADAGSFVVAASSSGRTQFDLGESQRDGGKFPPPNRDCAMARSRRKRRTREPLFRRQNIRRFLRMPPVRHRRDRAGLARRARFGRQCRNDRRAARALRRRLADGTRGGAPQRPDASSRAENVRRCRRGARPHRARPARQPGAVAGGCENRAGGQARRRARDLQAGRERVAPQDARAAPAHSRQHIRSTMQSIASSRSSNARA